ncbi:MAG: hypothetical protein ACRC8A_04775 [Microcoleaceae cyanobacterium]
MSKKHNRPSPWSDASLSSSASGDPSPEQPPARKSRADRLRELRTLLNSGLQEKRVSREEPRNDPSSVTNSDVLNLVQPTHSSQLTPSSPVPKPNISLKLLLRLAPLWIALLVVTPAGIGYMASNLLLKSPSLPNCPKIFWPVASASLRLYCAEIAAGKQTAEDLLSAIQLVDRLPQDHPLRPEINRRIESWSIDILTLSEELFQAGDLSGAVQGARKVPEGTPAHAKVEEQVRAWESLWKKAEAIYRKVEEKLRREETTLAFREATQLLNVGNRHWETTQYRKLTDLIQITREESAKLVAAKDLADRGGEESLVKAITKVQEIGEESYLYDRAAQVITQYSKSLLKIAEGVLAEGDWQRASNIVKQIPNRANLRQEVDDFTLMAQAHAPAALDTVAGLKDAISQLRKISRDRPLYRQAQQYIQNWQREIADVGVLEKARKLAQSGEVRDLKVAVAQLRAVPASNPRGSDAEAEAIRWTNRIQEIEDMPYLEMADQVASFGDVESLKEAITHAQKISQDRSLYSEAQSRIAEWSERSQRMEYQPLLDQAQQLASEGRLTQAIALAGKVRPGIVLHGEAQSNINRWKVQLQDVQSIQGAEQAASGGTADSLALAIKLASRVSLSSSWRSQANQLIDDWSQQLLQTGLDQSTYDVEGAIATLRKIPYGSSAYYAAQGQIRDWEAWLNPPSVEPPEEPQQTPSQSESYPNEPSNRYNESPTNEPLPRLQPQEVNIELNKPVTPDKPDTQ